MLGAEGALRVRDLEGSATPSGESGGQPPHGRVGQGGKRKMSQSVRTLYFAWIISFNLYNNHLE